MTLQQGMEAPENQGVHGGIDAKKC